jgi:hypothetical protein
MTSDGMALAAIVILLFPIGYFFLASPAFLLVKLRSRNCCAACSTFIFW